MYRKYIVPLLILLLPTLVLAQSEVNKEGTTAANFLKLEVGGRAIALGGAYTTLADDGTAMHYNPAGLADFTKLALTYHSTNLYAGIQQQYVGMGVPFGDANTIGVFINYVDIGEIEQTTITDPNGNNRHVSASDVAYGVAFSRRLTDRVLFGMTVKYVQEKIWHEKAQGVAADFGAIYEPGFGGLRIGMAIKNLGPEMKMDEGPAITFSKEPSETYPGQRPIPSKYIMDSYALPTTFSMGVAFDFVGPTSVIMANDMHRLSVVSEVSDAFDAPLRSIIGGEYMWNDMLALRGGVRQNYDLFNYSFGGGLKIPVANSEIVVDYAYADYGDLDGIYVTSLELRF